MLDDAIEDVVDKALHWTIGRIIKTVDGEGLEVMQVGMSARAEPRFAV